MKINILIKKSHTDTQNINIFFLYNAALYKYKFEGTVETKKRHIAKESSQMNA